MVDVQPDPEGRRALVERLQSAASIVVITGAGISLASGIPTFRGTDPGAVWADGVLERGTRAYFMKHPVERWRFYLERFAAFADARPNPGHHALARIEAWQRGRGRDFTLITQNIDGLHAAAGSREVIEIHGSAARARCVERGCRFGAPRGSVELRAIEDVLEAFREAPSVNTLPTCELCGALLRPHILWFDEYYTGHRDYRVDDALRSVKRAGVLLYVGTSFAVGITEMTLEIALARGRALFSVDPVGEPPRRQITWLKEQSEHALPAVADALAGAG